MLRNGTPASPAVAFASSVLPVPGGPESMAPCKDTYETKVSSLPWFDSCQLDTEYTLDYITFSNDAVFVMYTTSNNWYRGFQAILQLNFKNAGPMMP